MEDKVTVLVCIGIRKREIAVRSEKCTKQELEEAILERFTDVLGSSSNGRPSLILQVSRQYTCVMSSQVPTVCFSH